VILAKSAMSRSDREEDENSTGISFWMKATTYMRSNTVLYSVIFAGKYYVPYN